ncbi:hypothetical protein [Facilibium subflavum]|uniref:hypothetical protein n=1 Tax=Facilibium subflavum TaxID=2219058 RepID=UPI0013C2D650|nr:hypothetical protein [Facilibium subflavum]
MHLCNLLKSDPKIIGAVLMACRSGKSKDDKKLCKKYEEFYKDHFYNKFEQLYHAEPSSFHYTCYQKIVSYENAVNVIWEQYSKIYSAQMKKNKLLQSEKNTPQIFEGFEINNKKEIGSVKQKDL